MLLRKLLLPVSIIMSVALPLAAAYQTWAPSAASPGFLSNATAILPHPFERDRVLASATNQIYVASGESPPKWTRDSILPESGIKISRLLHFPGTENFIFAFTDTKIFRKEARAPKWMKLFEIHSPEARMTDFAVSSTHPLLFSAATTQGLFQSLD